MAFALHATGGELPAHPVDALVEVVEEEQRGHNHDHGDRHPHEGVDHGGDGGIGPHGERAPSYPLAPSIHAMAAEETPWPPSWRSWTS